MENKRQIKKPTFGYSVFVLGALACVTFVGMKFMGASLNVVMFLNWLLMTVLAIPLGFNYDMLEKKASESLSGVLTTLFIIFAIGGLIGTWMASGTVPAIIYYGMNIMNAKFFLLTSLVLCSIVSVATGTSWGTLGTMGVALLGIGAGLGVPAGMTAGAVICGSWFGDKVSPLSDTTNFTSAIVGTTLATHIKHMMYTTLPAYLISAVIFTVLGFKVSAAGGMDYTLIQEVQNGISGTYQLGFATAIPVLVVIAMLLMRKNPTIALLAGSLSGIVVAVIYQGSATGAAFNSLYNGFSGTFESDFLASLLNRGGIVSMLSTCMTIIFCVGIGGMMKEMGVIEEVVKQLAKLISSVFSLVLLSEIIAYIAQMLSGSHYFSDVILHSTMLDIYKEKGLKPENLSRVMEDCNTIGGTMIPWSSTALYIVATLGVSFTSYIPFVFLCYINPIMGLFCAATGWGVAHYDGAEQRAETISRDVVTE